MNEGVEYQYLLMIMAIRVIIPIAKGILTLSLAICVLAIPKYHRLNPLEVFTFSGNFLDLTFR